MRQVPNYAIIGNGRMATHLCHYFDHLAVNYHQWARSKQPLSDLDPILSNATHALILITDDAIEGFIQQFILPKHSHLILIHFSGSLNSNLSYTAHPLQTFPPNTLYSLEEYQKIPFVLEDTGQGFHQLLPQLSNPHYYIRKQDKGYYHAMCVLANNLSTLLWQKFYCEMQARFEIKPSDLEPYLKRTFENIRLNPETALTGPIARRDVNTLRQNLEALSGDPYQKILKEFVKQSNLEI